MKVRVYPLVTNAVEIDGCVFSTAEQVERFIRALEAAKKIVWPPQAKLSGTKK